jgi:hypothetical protein
MENNQDLPLEIATDVTCHRDEETIDSPTPPATPVIACCCCQLTGDSQVILTAIELETVCSG